MNVSEQIKLHKDDVRTDSYTMSMGELINLYRDGEIHISPEYQRLFRWSPEQQSRLVESMLLDLPIPAFFFAQIDNNHFEVIDGLQRICTILKFFAPLRLGEKSLEGMDEEENKNKVDVALKLTAGPLLTALEGHTCLTLPESLSVAIKRYRIQIIFLKAGVPKRTRYEVFKRVNTYGSVLSNQEIRNCTTRLLGIEFPETLRKISQEECIDKALGLSDFVKARQGQEEMILRLLAFSYFKDKLSHDIRDFLDDFMDFASDGKFDFSIEIQSKIINCFKLIHSSYEDGDAFRFRKKGNPYGQFSTNLFDIVSCGVFHNIENLTTNEFASKLETLLTSDKIKDLTGAGSNTKKKMIGRVDTGIKWFSR